MIETQNDYYKEALQKCEAFLFGIRFGEFAI